MSLGMFGDYAFNETRWPSRGSTGIKEIKSIENRIRCLAAFRL